MTVDVIVSDEGVSGGVSYADRKLGKELLPMMVEGDALIVSEVSRLGRSMYDLSKLVHDELKPRKLRLIVVGMGIDLNCAKITPIDQLILSQFAFAAELEKHLIRERTLSALQVKRQQGVKFGRASEKYKQNWNNKSTEEKIMIERKRGETKRARFQESLRVRAFLKILTNVFPDATKNEDPHDWDWKSINSKGEAKDKILNMMKTMRDLDDSGHLFHKFDFDADDKMKQCRLCAMIHSIKRTFYKA